MLGTVCGQSVPEREMSRDVGEGSSVRPRGPGTVQKYLTALQPVPYYPVISPS